VKPDKREIWLILGPSGVGKSFFAEFLKKKRGWTHIDIDQYPPEGNIIDVLKLRAPWDAYWKRKDAAPLRQELEIRAGTTNGCVMSFASTLILSREHIVAANKALVKVVYLYGSRADCKKAFVKRERKLRSGLDLNHWKLHNQDFYAEIGRSEFREHRVRVFGPDGKHLSCSAIFKEIRSKIK